MFRSRMLGECFHDFSFNLVLVRCCQDPLWKVNSGYPVGQSRIDWVRMELL